jgi:TIR domain
MAESRDFFISFNKADGDWAAWIAWTLEHRGYRVFFQDWDFVPGSNFVLEMDQAARQSSALILVLSRDYLNASFTAPEWAAFLARDPKGIERKLKPIRVRDCQPEGLLGQVVYADLIGLPEKDARKALLSSVTGQRRKPKTAAPFPDGPAAMFPGAGPQSALHPVLWLYLRATLPTGNPSYARLASDLRGTGGFRLMEHRR